MEHEIECQACQLGREIAVQVVSNDPRFRAAGAGGVHVDVSGLDHDDGCTQPQQLHGHVSVAAAQLQHPSAAEEALPEQGDEGVQPLPTPGDVVGVPEEAHGVGMEPHCSYCAWVSANCGPGPDEEDE